MCSKHMTYDKATYTITFKNCVPATMPHRLQQCADSDELTVEVDDVTDNVLQLSVYGSGYAIPVFEEEMRDRELYNYPSVEIDCDVEVGVTPQ